MTDKSARETTDLVEKCATAYTAAYENNRRAQATGFRMFSLTEAHRVGILAVIDALAEAVSDEMGDAFDKAHVAYWSKHWVDSQDASFWKTRRAANRIALSAAIRAAKSRDDTPCLER